VRSVEDSSNLRPVVDITRTKARRRVGARKEQIVVRQNRQTTPAIGLLLICVVAAACGATAAPTLAPTANATPPAPSTTVATLAPTAAAASPAPALKLLWEKAGAAAAGTQNVDTYWPAIDPLTGNVWVAASFEGAFWTFSQDGTFVGAFGAHGRGPGEFDFSRPACPKCGAGAIAFAPDGSFFVADDGNDRIQKFDAAHHFVKAWGSFGDGPGQFSDANAIATDGRQVYVYDDGRTDVQVFDTDGKLLRTMTNLYGWLTVDKAGNLWAPNADGLVEFDATGKQLKAYSLPDMGPRISLAIDAAGRLYFNLQDRNTPNAALALVRFDPTTSSLTQFSTAGETLAMSPASDAIYEANFISPGWPAPVLRKYALPAK
jgi:hypothetical protein